MFSLDILNFMICFLLTIISTIMIIKNSNFFLKFRYKNTEGPQKIHRGEIPRIAGLSIFTVVGIMSLYTTDIEKDLFQLFFLVSIPIFIFGFLEDLTHAISPRLRLLGAVVSSILYIIVCDSIIHKTNFYILDVLLNYQAFSIFFTVLCITFMTQAYNIIDGLNGLSLMTAIFTLIGIAIMAHKFDDIAILHFTIYLIIILIGVLFFNFPYGKIFIGDAGAYIIGLYISFSIIILTQNKEKVSAIFAIYLLIYPSYELVRSFFRRLISNKSSVFQPDNKHLHSLLHIKNYNKYNFKPVLINSLTSLQITLFHLLNVIIAVNFFNNTKILIVATITFIIIYELFYFILTKKIESFQN